MSWNTDHYHFDDDGNFYDQDEYDNAVESGDISLLFNGCGWDRETGDEFWPDGTKK